MYNVELFNRTARQVIASRQAKTEAGAADIARDFIEQAKRTGDIIHASNYQTSPRGYVFGQTITTGAGVFDISTGKMR